jgi:thiol-disulfide isomerase/thioredoxin
MTVRNHLHIHTRKEQAAARRRREKIRNIALIAGSILVLVAMFIFLFREAPIQNVSPAHVGSELGEFSLTDISGNTIRLKDYSGRPVLINAWATWCPPCKAEMPLLNQYYQAHANQGFTLLAVNAGDSKSVAASFANQNRLAFPVLLDPGSQLLNQLGIHSFPTSILIGKDGKVKLIHVGMFTADAIEKEITPFLN